MGVYRDYGAGRNPVIKSQKNASLGVCSSSSCGKKTFVSKNAWFRKSRPLCPHCGAFLDPSEGLQGQEPEFSTRGARRLPQGRCCICHARLSSVSIEDGLSVCNSRLCHKAVEELGEFLCVAGGLCVRGIVLTDLGGGRWRMTGFARGRHQRDMRTIDLTFEKGEIEL